MAMLYVPLFQCTLATHMLETGGLSLESTLTLHMKLMICKQWELHAISDCL